MPKTKPPYAAEFRQQMVDLFRTGCAPEDLGREFEPSAQAVQTWVAQAGRDAGERSDGLRTEEREELRRLRLENRRQRGSERRRFSGQDDRSAPYRTSSEPPRANSCSAGSGFKFLAAHHLF